VALPARHIIHQGPVLASIGRTALRALGQRLQKPQAEAQPRGPLPGPEIRARIPPLPAALVRDYLRHVGGDPAAYRGTIPPHLFPQWSFALAADTLRALPYPLLRVVNGGCRLQMNAPLPAGEPFEVRARLESVDDDGRRAVLRQRIVTGTAAQPEALQADLYAIVPIANRAQAESEGNGRPARPSKEAPSVPARARELAYWSLGPDTGLAFAMLTGDFNPVHWLRPYARAFGFRSPILHGFATLARAVEGLQRGLFAGAVDALRVVDVRFTRPLCLPARVGLYVDGHDLYVGDAVGAPAYLAGTFEQIVK